MALIRTLFDWLPFTPFGLVLWPAQALGCRMARKQLPECARRLGLKHYPALTSGEVGILAGSVGGQFVIAEPDDGAKVTVFFATRKPLRLSESANPAVTDGLAPFSTGHKEIDARLRTRLADDPVATYLRAHPETLLELLSLVRRHPWRIRHLTVEPYGVVARLRHGHPNYAHIPPEALERVLPALANATGNLDRALGNTGDPVDADSQLYNRCLGRL